MSSSSEDTIALGEKIGQILKAPLVIELLSDVGGGKTTFTRGLVKGLGSSDQVASPSFTISRIYDLEKGNQVHHFDFYRLDDAGLMRAELTESFEDEGVITVVEWANIVEEVLPEDRLIILIKYTGDDSRKITVQSSNIELISRMDNHVSSN